MDFAVGGRSDFRGIGSLMHLETWCGAGSVQWREECML